MLEPRFAPIQQMKMACTLHLVNCVSCFSRGDNDIFLGETNSRGAWVLCDCFGYLLSLFRNVPTSSCTHKTKKDGMQKLCFTPSQVSFRRGDQIWKSCWNLEYFVRFIGLRSDKLWRIGFYRWSHIAIDSSVLKLTMDWGVIGNIVGNFY